MTDDGTDEDKDSSFSTSKTITSETSSGTTVTTTTTHISKVSCASFLPLIPLDCGPLLYTVYAFVQVVKSGSSETRVEKRIVITADSDVDQEKVNDMKHHLLPIKKSASQFNRAQNKEVVGSRWPLYEDRQRVSKEDLWKILKTYMGAWRTNQFQKVRKYNILGLQIFHLMDD